MGCRYDQRLYRLGWRHRWRRVGHVSMVDVSLQVPLGKVRPPAARISIPCATVSAHKHCPEPGLLHPDHLLFAAWTHHLHVVGVGTPEAENVLARYHATVDQDWVVALVAAVDHRVEYLLADQVHFVGPA